jgi:hypothetical protein
VAVEYATASLEVRNHAIRQALGELGYTPVDAVRASYWSGEKPFGYRWDARILWQRVL